MLPCLDQAMEWAAPRVRRSSMRSWRPRLGGGGDRTGSPNRSTSSSPMGSSMTGMLASTTIESVRRRSSI